MLQMGKMSMLELEMEDLHKVQKCLEREKEMAKEENERLRRQVGCRIGAETDLETSLETLQREYNSMLEENRSLKRKVS